MTTTSTGSGLWLHDDQALDLPGFAQACGVEVDFVRLLVQEGMLQPTVDGRVWRFGGDTLTRVRRICRLQRDFDASLSSVAVLQDLLDEVAYLRARLQRGG
jgi:chaperone modulatory protein CbpM